MFRKLLVALSGAALLAACGAGENATYASVKDLRAAYIEAGFRCNDWEQSDAINGSDESGSCSDADVLAIYPTKEAAFLGALGPFVFGDIVGAEEDPDTTIVLGPNWTINTGDPEKVREELGGRVVTVEDFEKEKSKNSSAYQELEKRTREGLDDLLAGLDE